MRSDQVASAKSLAARLHRDRSAGRIDAPLHELEEMAMAVQDARADGVNPRTASKDAFALREFELFASLRGFDPNLQSQWVKDFPEREGLKMASFLLFRAHRAQPRSKSDIVAKPLSIYANYLALRRVFKSRSVDLVPSGVVRETLRGLLKRFIRRIGIDALRPKQVEPISLDIIRQSIRLAEQGTRSIGRLAWKRSNWNCFITQSWMVINLPVGSRKGEATMLPGDVDENDWFSRSSVAYTINGRVYVDPEEGDLLCMKEGDHASLSPKGSKCDA